MRSKSNSEIDTILMVAHESVSNRDYLPAIRHYTRAIDLEPTRLDIAVWLSETYSNVGSYVLAGQVLYKFIENNKVETMPPANLSKLYRSLGHVKANQGLPLVALSFYLMARSLDPAKETYLYVRNMREILSQDPTSGTHSGLMEKFRLYQELGAFYVTLLDGLIPKSSADSLWGVSWALTESGPSSITGHEGVILYKLIRELGLTRGFEVATGFGFSTAFIAAAFKETDGYLRSIDSYIEETLGSMVYPAASRVSQGLGFAGGSSTTPKGLLSAQTLLKRMNLVDRVNLLLGTSPNDLPLLLEQEKFDFVYIDGGHFNGQPQKDFKGIMPFLSSERCVVAFHDNIDNHDVSEAISMAEDFFSTAAIVFDTKHLLTVVAGGFPTSTLAKIQAVINGV